MRRFFSTFHSFFVPKEENNFRAKTLHLSTLTVFLIGVLLLSVFFGTLESQSGEVLGYATDITSGRLHELTNQKRTENGLSSLSYSEKLAAAANSKAQHMFAHNYWAHYSPDGTAPWGFILSTGYEYSFAGENLAKNFMFNDDVVSAWMNSESHRQNMLRQEYTDVGFAIVNGMLNGEETTLVVQMFGAPLTGSSQASSESPPQQAQVPITVAPTLVVQEKPAPSAVLARQTTQPSLNLLPLYLNLNYIFIGIFVLALICDFYLASKLRVVRISGKNVAHFIFVAFMMVGLLIVTKGAIQ